VHKLAFADYSYTSRSVKKANDYW